MARQGRSQGSGTDRLTGASRPHVPVKQNQTAGSTGLIGPPRRAALTHGLAQTILGRDPLVRPVFQYSPPRRAVKRSRHSEGAGAGHLSWHSVGRASRPSSAAAADTHFFFRLRRKTGEAPVPHQNATLPKSVLTPCAAPSSSTSQWQLKEPGPAGILLASPLEQPPCAVRAIVGGSAPPPFPW